MLSIKYNTSNNSYHNLSLVSDNELRYSLFLGNIIFCDNEKTISIDWEWIPIFDFAICMNLIYINLSKKIDNSEDFEFTESDEKIFFNKDGDLLKITFSFSDISITCRIEEFRNATFLFWNEVVKDLLKSNPELSQNEVFNGYLKEFEHFV